MLIVKSRPWTEIAELYRFLSGQRVAFRSMQNLVEQISASRYAAGLFAATSMHTLLIAQTPEFDWDREILRVSLDFRTGALVFDFQETGSNLPKYQHWIRHCPPEEGFSRLERFPRAQEVVRRTQALTPGQLAKHLYCAHRHLSLRPSPTMPMRRAPASPELKRHF
jgi:hypothetical protein